MDAVADDQSTASEESRTSDTSAEKGKCRQDGQDSVVPDHIKISAVPAVVSWTGPDGQAQYLSRYPHDDQDLKTQTTFDADADFIHRTALFRLRVPILSPAPADFHAKRPMTNIFLFIYPEHIRALTLVRDDGETTGEPANTVPNMLGGVQVCRLRFELDTPCALVGPRDRNRDALSAADKGSVLGHVLGQLQALACATTFTVNVPSTRMPKGFLMLLCQSASQLTTMKRSSNLGSLYGGRGGMVLPPVVALGVASHDESPPSYHELQQGRSSSWQPLKPGTTAIASDGPLKKRPRYNSSSPDIIADKGSVITSDLLTINEIFRAMTQHFEHSLSALQNSVDRGFGEMRSRMDGVEDRLGKLEARLDQVQTLCTDEIDTLRHDIQKDLDDARDESREIIDTELDDRSDVIREEMKEFIVEQVEELGSRTTADILQSLKDTEVRIRLDI